MQTMGGHKLGELTAVETSSLHTNLIRHHGPCDDFLEGGDAVLDGETELLECLLDIGGELIEG